jgi:hypothetical protein
MSNQLCASVPYNCFGFQYPASGNAYSGFLSFSAYGGNNREFLGTQLTNTMIIGQKYFVKFKLVLSLDNTSNSSSDKVGVRFSTVQHNSVTSTPPINNFSHIYATTQISDTLNWTTIFKSFVADSNYAYVEAGNFFDDANTNYAILRPQATNTSYYYFDEFCVSTDSLFTLNYTTNINEYPLNELMFYPNPTMDGTLFFNRYLNKTTLKFYDLQGKLIKIISIEYSNYCSVDIPNGLYFLKIESNENTILKKIIINNPQK